MKITRREVWEEFVSNIDAETPSDNKSDRKNSRPPTKERSANLK
jgi:hypothetical protein